MERAEGRGGARLRGVARALAEIADPLFIQSVLDAKSALDRFGGELFVGTDRRKFNSQGQEISRGVGDFETVAYVFHWNSRTQIGTEIEEPAQTREEVVAEVDASPNGEAEHSDAEEAVESAAGS
jgi:hypothetical protein